jgi:hypothetical protein
MVNTSIVDENRQAIGRSRHRASSCVGPTEKGWDIYLCHLASVVSRASTDDNQGKDQSSNRCAFLGVHRFFPPRSILDLAAPSETAGISQGKTLLCRSRIAQGI